jgi:hypothetical protein
MVPVLSKSLEPITTLGASGLVRFITYNLVEIDVYRSSTECRDLDTLVFKTLDAFLARLSISRERLRVFCLSVVSTLDLSTE